MPRIKLTKNAIDSLPTSASDTIYWDTGCPGFGVKVTPKGRKVFVVLYRTGGAGSSLRKYTIGVFGRVTLHQARVAAQRVFAAKLEGRDPAIEKRTAKQRVVADRVDELLDAFIAQHVSQNRSASEISRLLRREVGKVWGHKSIHEISKRDVVDVISAIDERGAPVAANKALKTIKTFLRWCVGRAVLDQSPADGVPLPAKEVARDRVLTDPELAQVILAARTMGDPYRGIVELLALTGQRREEVAGATWDEFDLDQRIWTLPKARTKNAKQHTVHLSAQAIAVLKRMKKQGPLVFSFHGSTPFQGFSLAKRGLDEMSGVKNWRLHDLRRTCVSGMARLGIPPHVADKILNHQSGTISGVAAVYQRHDFLDERNDALERWGTHLAKIVVRRLKKPPERNPEGCLVPRPKSAGDADNKPGDPNQSESLCREAMNDVPAGFLPLSSATNRLTDGMWGGLPRPDPVATIKQEQKKLSLGFGPWREEAGRRLRAAAVEGNLVIYVLAIRPVRSEDHSVTECSLENIEPVVVPVSVLERLITSHGSLPDHPIRPSMKTAEGNEKLFALLAVGLLVVRANDFDGWYQSERAKGRWPSQESKEKKDGRPTKQTGALRNAVLALVHDHKWSGKDPISALHRLLVASGRSDVPSQDTLARLVNQLHRETGEAALLRIPRARRKQI